MKYHAAELRAGFATLERETSKKLDPDGPEAAKIGGASEKLAALMGGGSVPVHPFSSRYRLQLERLTADYERKVLPMWEAFSPKFDAASDQLRRSIERIESGNGGCRWKEYEAALDRYYPIVREGMRQWSATRPLLEAYWRESGAIIASIHDRPTFEYADQMRRVTVAGWASQWSFLGSAQSAMMGVAAGVGRLGCGQGQATTPRPGPRPQAERPIRYDAQRERKTPCPGSLSSAVSFKALAFAFKFNCEVGEIQFAEGLAVGLKRRFASREMEIFVGAGGALHFSKHLSIEGRAGATFTFADGKLVDMGGKFDVGVAGGMGALEGGVEVSASFSAVAPPKIEIGRTGGFRFSRPGQGPS